MATTRYTVAATPNHAEKIISNLKSAKTEADARAKGERVDVTVTTVATGKLTYTAFGAPTAQRLVDESVEQTLASEAAEQAAEEQASAEAMATAEESVAAEAAAEAEAQRLVDESVEQTLASEAAEEGDFDAMLAEVKAEADTKPKTAPCGCEVAVIVASGEHSKGCADAPKKAAATQAVKKAAPAKPAKKAAAKKAAAPRATGRRAAQGEAAVSGWELLYDKPKQNAQVGRRDGQYALICTTHKFVRPVAKLVEERAVRKAGGWCEKCSH